jgi:hypothetical protein
MRSFRTILALGILALSSPAFAGQFQFHAAPPSCKGPIADFFHDLGFKKACEERVIHEAHSTVAVPEPATLGLLGIGLIGLAVKRRRK